MSRWKQEDILPKSLNQRKWLETEKGKEYRIRHNEYVKKWRIENKEKFKITQKRAYDKVRYECLSYYSNGETPVCICCGEKEILFLYLDHIEGDGANHRKILRKELGYYPGGNNLPYWLKKNNYPSGFQVLCANCNLGKRIGKYCPHELRRGIDMNGMAIPTEELPKPHPPVTRRPKGEAQKEADDLGISKATLRMRRWREKQNALRTEPSRTNGNEGKTHCKHGHPLDEINAYLWRGHRQCRACKRDYKVRQLKKRKEPHANSTDI